MSLNEGRCDRVKCHFSHTHGTKRTTPKTAENTEGKLIRGEDKDMTNASTPNSANRQEKQGEAFLGQVQMQHQINLMQSQLEQILQQFAQFHQF